DGIRPEFAVETPDFYIQLANQCINSNPSERPTAKRVYEKLYEWKIILGRQTEELNIKQLEVRDKFSKANKIIPVLSKTLHEDEKRLYKSEHDNIHNV
ncbi:12492_t:CDS:1, partial [Dentiscutata heterogama]